MRGDTVRDTTVTYNAGEFGNWSAASDFHWYESLHGSWMAGSFEPTPVPELAVHYDLTEGDATDHLHIRLTDSDYERATATGNDYMTVHDALEGFATVTDDVVTGAFERVTGLMNPGPVGGMQSLTILSSVQETVSISAGGGITIAAVQAQLGVANGAVYQTQVGGTVTFSFVANEWNWVERAPIWRHRTGTADCYGTSGYIGLGTWEADAPDHPWNPLIDYADILCHSATLRDH